MKIWKESQLNGICGGTPREGIANYFREPDVLKKHSLILAGSEVGTEAALDLMLVGGEENRVPALSPRITKSVHSNFAPLICTSPIPLLSEAV